MTAPEPRTIPERLDATQDGDEFALVLGDMFTALAAARDEEEV